MSFYNFNENEKLNVEEKITELMRKNTYKYVYISIGSKHNRDCLMENNGCTYSNAYLQMLPSFLFNKQDNEIKLTLYEVLKPADILKLTILNKESKKPVSNVNTLAFQNGELLSSSKSDSLGYSRLRIPLNREKDIPINILIDTDGKFQLYRREIVIKEGTSEEIIMLSSLKLEIGETVYQVIDDLVPFREGPENGSSVLFFLNSGDQVVVSKVAGDRLFGRVNVFLEMQGRYKNVNGWILHKYVIIKDI